jgi:hypothetical protein
VGASPAEGNTPSAVGRDDFAQNRLELGEPGETSGNGTVRFGMKRHALEPDGEEPAG